MRKNLILLMAVLIIGLGLSACTGVKNPKTTAEIQADCLKIQPIQSNLTELTSFKVDSTSLSTDLFVAQVTIELKTLKETVKAKVTMNYKKFKETWYVDTSEIKIITATISDLDSLKAQAALKIADNLLKAGHYDGTAFQNAPVITLTKNLGDGILTTTFVREGAHGFWTNKVEGTINGTYDLNQGWTFALGDNTYTETSHWAGNYELKHFVYNGDTPTLDDSFPLILTGSLRLDVDAQGNETVISDLIAEFIINGKSIFANGNVDWLRDAPNTRGIVFHYGAGASQTITLLCEFDESMNFEPYFTGTVNGIFYVLAVTK